MGFAHLVESVTVVEAFKAKYHIPPDVFIEYYPEGNIGIKGSLGLSLFL